MSNNIPIKQLNDFVSSHLWYEFVVLNYSPRSLVVVGGIDLSYSYEIKITFVNVFFISMNLEWKIDSTSSFIEIVTGSEEFDLNIKNKIESGNTIFKITTDDDLFFYIAAEEINAEFAKINF